MCFHEKIYVDIKEGDKALGTLATDATGELDVLGHDGHALGVNGAEVRVLKETHEVGLGSRESSGSKKRYEFIISFEEKKKRGC